MAIPESRSPICPSTIILLATGLLKPPLVPALAGLLPPLLYLRFTGINLLHFFCLQQVKSLCSPDWEPPGRIDYPPIILITRNKREGQGKELLAQVLHSQ